MKKKIVSMLLALTLAVSGMPVGMTAEVVNAAEISKSEVFTETEDVITFNVSGDGKAVGSDGVTYENVAYLSADTVKSLGAEGQSTYIEICDQIAEERNANDYLKSAVIAVDEEGNLIFHYSVSMKALYASMEEFAENAFEDATAASEDEAKEDEKAAEITEAVLTQEDVEEVTVADDSDKENIQQGEASDDANESDTIAADEAEETSKVENPEKDADVEQEETSTADHNVTEDVFTENGSAAEEELSTEESLSEDAAAEETEAAAEVSVPSAENMELIVTPEAEEFEIIENAKADVIVDLGYGNKQQFNSILPTSDWFSKQLTNSQKTIYNACKVLAKGKNTFTFSGSKAPSISDIDRAISACLMSEPYKCDWIDWTQDYTGKNTFLVSGGKETYKQTEVTIPKSTYYTPEIQKAANARVMEIAAEAQQYAIENYPSYPVYGIVEYYDKWICEHNYYNMDGTIDPVPASLIQTNYYCHSSYGALLKGYGVCESYALAMTRLLDAIGIPNMYATGMGNGGGHAWNYIEMPDGKWYLQDSTWNEVDSTSDKVDSASTQNYLLCGDDEKQADGKGHIPMGTKWLGLEPFTFVDRSSSRYAEVAKGGEIIFSKHYINLEPKQKEALTCNNAYTEDENVPKVWMSSNEKVAKVDQNGNVTAVAPGIAEITYVVSGISDSCAVVVSQINSLTFDDSGKPNHTTSGNIVDGKGQDQHVYLSVNQKVPVFTAEELRIEETDHTGEYAEILNAAEILPDVDIKPSDASVATVTHTVTGDTIDLKITPLKVGKTKIVITFGKKKATLNYSVGEALDENWFDLNEVKKLEEESKAGTLMYTGKAYKPKVVLSEEGKAKKVKFKVSYLNNKDAGKASVIITGTGTYGGELRRTFTIKPLTLNVDTSSLKVQESALYNGGVNQTKSTVKHLNGTKKVGLKVGKDYDIIYTKNTTSAASTTVKSTTRPTEVGTYTMEIRGKGNYAGTVKVKEGEVEKEVVPTTPIEGKTWTIKPNELKKVKVSVKVNGTVPVVTVAIGKNVLPSSDYELTYYTDKACEDQIPGSVFMKKTQYFIKVVPKETGSNIEMGAKGKPIVKNFKTK